MKRETKPMQQPKTLIAGLAAVAIGLAVAKTAVAAEAGAAGLFSGASGHVTSGSVEIEKTPEGYVVRLGPDFSLDGAPDPKVGFGRDGKFAPGTLIGKLKSLKGAQSFRVPAGLDIRVFDQVYIWCERFSVPLGAARLN